MLIKLTAIPSPDFADLSHQPCFVERERVISITRVSMRPARLAAMDEHLEALDKLWQGTQKLAQMVSENTPAYTDPTSVQWHSTVRESANALSAAYSHSVKFDRNRYHPRITCTEIALAAGTAENGGMMLQRVWVTETPEEVAIAMGHNPLLGRRST